MKFATLLAVAALATVFSFPQAASAYVVKRSSTGASVRWYNQKIAIRIDPALEAMLPAGEVRAAAAMASDAWRGIGDAPELVVEAGSPDGYSADSRTDSIYLVKDWPYNTNQVAVTVLNYSKDGRILGMDVLVNGNKRFAMLSENDSRGIVTGTHDLGAVLTHEFGHVLGLDESDDHEEATMFPYVRAGEVRQRVLSADDEEGVVAAYKAELPKAPAACSVSANVGANSSHSGLFGALLMLGAAVAVSRKRAA